MARSQLTDTEAHADECVLASSRRYNKANIFLGLIEYQLNSLLGANYASVHIRFDLERYLLIIIRLQRITPLSSSDWFLNFFKANTHDAISRTQPFSIH